ncbi:MAG: hypothetical protein ACE5FF_03030 [Saprospiraceae bacterium]
MLFNRRSYRYWRRQADAFLLLLRQGDRTAFGLFALSVFSTIIISWFCVQVYKVNHATLVEPEPLTTEDMLGLAELESLSGEAYQPFRGAKISQHAVALRKETVNWIGILQNFEDEDLPAALVVKKYHNLSIAASILSAIGKEPAKQRQWSRLAISYGRQAAKMCKALPPLRNTGVPGSNEANLELREDINIRILLAMALNYYQRGDISENDLKLQYLQINRDYLFRSGFCRYEILRALDDDGILELPGYHSLKNT